MTKVSNRRFINFEYKKINNFEPTFVDYKLYDLNKSYRDIFSTQEYSVTNKFKCPIRTYHTKPIYKRSRLSNEENELLREKVFQLLKSGQIQYSNSQWSSPVKLKELNGNLEICVDYNSLNEITYDEGDKVPSIKEIINSIDKSNIFSRIVIDNAFHQIEIEKSSQYKTAFATDFGRFEFRTLHRGMKNAQSVLQKVMENALEGVDKTNVKIYLGHILIHSIDEINHHWQILQDVLNRLRSANLKIARNDCRFFTRMINFLGYIVNQRGIWIHPNLYNQILNFEQPNSLHKLREFLSLIGSFKTYYPKFGALVKPLLQAANKSTVNDFYWDNLSTFAFNKLKELIASKALLISFENTKEKNLN